MKTLTTTIIILVAISSTLIAGGKKEETIEPENSMMMMVQDDQTQNMSDEPFIDFQDLEQAQMIAAEAPTVLFFHATWCPSCRSAREEFTKRSADLKSVNLILVDYDNSKDLQKKYGITYQHTFVQIDENGDAIAKWNGGATDELLSNIKKGDDS
jgi:thiol-disulfide isomerase/thioredoxin